jgi:hypothetical protein
MRMVVAAHSRVGSIAPSVLHLRRKSPAEIRSVSANPRRVRIAGAVQRLRLLLLLLLRMHSVICHRLLLLLLLLLLLRISSGNGSLLHLIVIIRLSAAVNGLRLLERRRRILMRVDGRLSGVGWRQRLLLLLLSGPVCDGLDSRWCLIRDRRHGHHRRLCRLRRDSLSLRRFRLDGRRRHAAIRLPAVSRRAHGR